MYRPPLSDHASCVMVPQIVTDEAAHVRDAQQRRTKEQP
jgi:hypothetical protein